MANTIEKASNIATKYGINFSQNLSDEQGVAYLKWLRDSDIPITESELRTLALGMWGGKPPGDAAIATQIQNAISGTLADVSGNNPWAAPETPSPAAGGGGDITTGPTGLVTKVENGLSYHWDDVDGWVYDAPAGAGQSYWANPTYQPTDVGGYTAVWDPTSGSYQYLQNQQDQAALAQKNYDYQLQLQKDQAAAQMALQQQQQVWQKQQEEVSAKNQLISMYAADPYKYYIQNWLGMQSDWANLNINPAAGKVGITPENTPQGSQMPPTPAAIAGLTYGKVGAGQAFSPTKLQYPSSQYYEGMLPSEKEMLGGTLNWMGINPADWESVYKSMIPGPQYRMPTWSQ